MSRKFYITTAIAYASRHPHVGNDYEIILTDCIARYHRLCGDEVFMLTGTDEHGQKIQELAEASGITPQAWVDRVAGEIKENYRALNISNDGFIRTTDKQHEAVIQKIFRKFYEQGDIYKSEYEGMYCTACESFYTEAQLVDGKCPDCGGEVHPAREESYFFRMSKYADRLMKYIEDHPDFIVPKSREREMVNNFLKPGLQDLCVSRTTFNWGVPVDFDPKHVVYVWIDALSNYITAIGYDPDHPSERFEHFWPADYHVIGKDILRFHTIYWPIMLMALGLPLPKHVFGHGWLLFGHDKMSKSKGNVMYSRQLAETFGVDGVRYYVLAEMPYAADGSISYERLISRYNTDLANTLGNLVNRTVAMTHKYFDGVIPADTAHDALDDELREVAAKSVADWRAALDEFRVADAVEALMTLARRANKYIDETAPWALAKDESCRARLGSVLYNLLEAIRFLALLCSPFMPSTSEAICAQLGGAVCTLESVERFGWLKSGEKVGEAKPLFARIDEKAFWKEREEDEKAKEKAEKEAAKAQKKDEKAEKKALPEGCIGIEDFMKVELRAAKVKFCEPVAKSDKLLRIELDDGAAGRQVVSGIAKWYAPDDLVGKTLVVVANLAPAKLRGVESQGMILAADVGDEARVVFLDDSVPAGARIR